MPLTCPGGTTPRFRFKKGTNVRLAFCGDTVKEAVKVKSNLPKGSTRSPRGDLGDQRGQEGMKVGIRKFKSPGRHETSSTHLPFTRERMVKDASSGPGDTVV